MLVSSGKALDPGLRPQVSGSSEEQRFLDRQQFDVCNDEPQPAQGDIFLSCCLLNRRPQRRLRPMFDSEMTLQEHQSPIFRCSGRQCAFAGLTL